MDRRQVVGCAIMLTPPWKPNYYYYDSNTEFALENGISLKCLFLINNNLVNLHKYPPKNPISLKKNVHLSKYNPNMCSKQQFAFSVDSVTLHQNW